MPNLLAQQEILEFCNFVANYDYSQLRAVDRSTEKAQMFKASNQGIISFLNAVDNHFSLSSVPEIRKYFLNLKQLPLSELDNIFLLANGLMRLRDEITVSELIYHLQVRKMSQEMAVLHSKLANSDQWVRYFHFPIEQRLEEEELSYLLPTYGKVIKAIQKLGVLIHNWMSIHAPEVAKKYEVLGNMEQSDRVKRTAMNAEFFRKSRKITFNMCESSSKPEPEESEEDWQASPSASSYLSDSEDASDDHVESSTLSH